jgi:hypothetical protein
MVASHEFCPPGGLDISLPHQQFHSVALTAEPLTARSAGWVALSRVLEAMAFGAHGAATRAQ